MMVMPDEDVVALFAGDQLRLARLARGLTGAELADRVGVTPAALSQYENGKSRPTKANVAKLALALGFPSSFFVQASGDSEDPREAFFRSLSRTTVKSRDLAGTHAIMVGRLASAIERRVELPPVNIPRYAITATGADNVEGAAAAATRVREEWGLGLEPVSHVVRVMEANGVVVARLAASSDTVDAFSMHRRRRPVVVLCFDKNDAARARFDAAHELGHLVMHSKDRLGDPSVEREAHAFAAEFLMPADAIRDQLPSRPDWRRLVELKHEWGVSLQALLYRCRELGTMTNHVYRRAVTEINQRNWRTAEPSPLEEVEQAELLPAAVELLEANGISIEMLAADARLPLDIVRRSATRGRPRMPVI
ncbi:MAG: ImmA/IrrE family metallo-endopeptidase [Thermoleophilia bacterium]|nr:ImmA/IrrE family metallo-endopeptidase [Thermoleophilia bacterium]